MRFRRPLGGVCRTRKRFEFHRAFWEPGSILMLLSLAALMSLFMKLCRGTASHEGAVISSAS